MLAVALGAGACGNGLVGPGDGAVVHQIQLTTPSLIATSLGETLVFTARALDQNGRPVPTASLGWASSDSTVLATDGEGRFRSRGNGTAIVRVTLLNDAHIRATANVDVRQTPARILLAADTVALFAIGHATSLAARVVDALGSDLTVPLSMVWTSTDPLVAVVDSAGRVTAKADGVAAISLRVGLLVESVVARVQAGVRISACVSSGGGAGDICHSHLISVRAAR